jgi:hypothetical protein
MFKDVPIWFAALWAIQGQPGTGEIDDDKRRIHVPAWQRTIHFHVLTCDWAFLHPKLLVWVNWIDNRGKDAINCCSGMP